MPRPEPLARGWGRAARRVPGTVELCPPEIRVWIGGLLSGAGVGYMQVRLLGPVDVALDDGSRPVSGLRRQAVLAALALHDGQVVSTDRLVEIV